MKNILILLIRIYRYLLSPLFPMCCRFTPTCSEYSISAIDKYGTLKGLYFSIRRIMKCHPFNPGGYDPVK
ncbi:MAG: membrane protein insertion efficiency factor YidD [Nitrospirae bacterium]|nr:membrane protein insertion efficiency factor YidD [Nitrospirota bacterium]